MEKGGGEPMDSDSRFLIRDGRCKRKVGNRGMNREKSRGRPAKENGKWDFNFFVFPVVSGGLLCGWRSKIFFKKGFAFGLILSDGMMSSKGRED